MFAAGVSAMILPGDVHSARRWVRPAESNLYQAVINPAYVTAEYEVHFWVSDAKIFEHGHHFLPVVFKRSDGVPAMPAGYHAASPEFWPPVRMNRPVITQGSVETPYIAVSR